MSWRAKGARKRRFRGEEVRRCGRVRRLVRWEARGRRTVKMASAKGMGRERLEMREKA